MRCCSSDRFVTLLTCICETRRASDQWWDAACAQRRGEHSAAKPQPNRRADGPRPQRVNPQGPWSVPDDLWWPRAADGDRPRAGVVEKILGVCKHVGLLQCKERIRNPQLSTFFASSRLGVFALKKKIQELTQRREGAKTQRRNSSARPGKCTCSHPVSTRNDWVRATFPPICWIKISSQLASKLGYCITEGERDVRCTIY